MLPLTKQERTVLVYLGCIFFAGILLNYAVKKYPEWNGLLNVMDSDRLVSKIDVNKAGYDELVKIPYIGPSTAKRIIAYRENHGLFPSIVAVKSVPGIYPSQYAVFSKFLKTGDEK